MQDIEYLMSMYPSGVKKLQRYVSEACDRMEYKNSPMYDEFPDHIVVNQMCDSICDTVISEEGLAQIQSFWSMAEKDRSDVEGLELKQEMSRLEAISTLPEHYTDDAKNSQSAKADTDYIEKTGIEKFYACHCTDFASRLALGRVSNICETGVSMQLIWE